LFKAIKQQDIDSVKTLIQNGVSAYQWQRKQEKSSFHSACDKFNIEILEILVNSIKVWLLRVNGCGQRQSTLDCRYLTLLCDDLKK
jgi:hypothetical protein